MEKTLNISKSSDLLNKINALALPRSEQIEAVDALKIANEVTTAIYALAAKAKQFLAWLNPQPKFKPE